MILFFFFKIQDEVKKISLSISVNGMCKSTDVTPTSTPKWWDVVISTLFFWRLECQNGPNSPGAHVYIGVRTLTWKADYWKELLELVFTMWGGCVPDSESLPTLKNIIWPPWSRASARLDSSCTPWVICEWWEWQIIVHFPWLWLILRVKVFLCCYRSGGLLKPSLNAPLSCREGQTLIFFLLWLLKWRYGSFPSRNGFSWL